MQRRVLEALKPNPARGRGGGGGVGETRREPTQVF